MASLTQWTWVWANSRNWWWTGRPGMLRFMGSQRVGHDWTELNFPEPQLCIQHDIYLICMVRFSCESTIRVFYCCCSVTKSCLTVCDLLDCSMPGFFVLCYLSEFVQIHVHELVMLSNHLILCCPLLLSPSIFPSIKVFSNKLSLFLVNWIFDFSWLMWSCFLAAYQSLTIFPMFGGNFPF